LPGILRGRCKDCGYESDRFADISLAVLLGRDHLALRVPEHEHLISDEVGELGAFEDLCLLMLPHPGEARTLEGVGMTLVDASRQGRMVRLRTVVCRACGTVYRQRRLFAAVGSTGCAIGIAVCLVSGIGAGVWGGSFEIGVLAFCGAMLVVSVGIELIEWSLLRRFRGRARALRRPETCPECGSSLAQSIVRWRRVPCPCCGKRLMRFRMVGQS
jgi:predicted Zn-ribbon and HTH transcriptional regulator